MKKELINEVLRQMLPHLNNAQSEQLKKVLEHTFYDCEIIENQQEVDTIKSNLHLIELFISSKRIEGCSE